MNTDSELTKIMLKYKSETDGRLAPWLEVYLETGINPFIAMFISKVKGEDSEWSGWGCDEEQRLP